jgi:osmotically-inducible protein OsmY
MNKGVALVGGVGLGAALMYIFDPDRGGRRRALIRDKAVAAGNKANDVAGKISRDVRNRANGLVAETKSLFKDEDVTDDVLQDRVRSKLGRYSFKIKGLEVSAINGTVTLTGHVAVDLVPKILRAVRLVRGVKEVDNQLQLSNETTKEEATDSSFQIQPAPLGL